MRGRETACGGLFGGVPCRAYGSWVWTHTANGRGASALGPGSLLLLQESSAFCCGVHSERSRYHRMLQTHTASWHELARALRPSSAVDVKAYITCR